MKVYNRSGKTLHIPNYGTRENGQFWELPDALAARYLDNPRFEAEASSRAIKPLVRDVPTDKPEVKETKNG